jgi:hypothetical protein
MGKRLLVTVVVALAVGSGVALVTALLLALADIYLAGHGRPTRGRPWIDGAFVHMSRADVILCCVSVVSVVVAGGAAWTRIGRGGRSGGKAG